MKESLLKGRYISLICYMENQLDFIWFSINTWLLKRFNFRLTRGRIC